MKRLFFALILITSVITGVFIPFSAHAASQYDNADPGVSELTARSPACSSGTDLTMVWSELFISQSGNLTTGIPYTWNTTSQINNSYSTSKALWDNKQRWGVSQTNTSGSNDYKYITIWYTDDPGAYITFHNAAPGNPDYVDYNNMIVSIHSGYSMRFLEVGFNSNVGDIGMGCKVYVNNSFATTAVGISWSPAYGPGYDTSGILFAYADVQYPTDYEGRVIPDTYTPPLQPRPEIPDLNIITASGYNLVVQDRNFNTFDQAPTLCVSELAPVIHYKLYERVPNSDILVDSGTMSPTVQYTRQLEKKAAKYRFEAQYDCGQGDYSFITAAQKDFEMNDFGALVRECSTDVAGFFCRMSSDLKFGVFSTTFQGLNTILSSMQTINPSNCNTNWIATAHFQSNILPVQNFPQQVCQFAQNMYLTSGKPFYTINQWLNIVLQGAAILLLVFGLLAIFGFKVRLPSPIGEDDGTDIRPDIATSSSISRHRGTYSRTPSSTRSTDATFTPGNSGKWHDRNPERWR